MWAAVPNTRLDSGLKLLSLLIMPLTPSTGLRSGVVGCPLRGAVGVALVVVDLVDAEGDHAVAAVFGVFGIGDGDDGLVGTLGAVGQVEMSGLGGGHYSDLTRFSGVFRS